MPPNPPEPFWLEFENVHIVPILHYRMEFAQVVRQAALRLRPAHVAVELPPFVREKYLEAVGRLPYLSFLTYGEDSQQGVALLPVEPTDPFAEAVRSGVELKAAVHFIDLALDSYPEVKEPMPDAYSIQRLGLEAYYTTYEELRRQYKVAVDDERESHMAWTLDRLRQEPTQLTPDAELGVSLRPGTVMVVCGMAHAAGILRHLREGTGRRGPGEATHQDVKIYNPGADTVVKLSFELPFAMALYELQRGGPGPEKTWEPPPPEDPNPHVATTLLDQIDRSDAVAALEKLLGMKDDPDEPHFTRELKRLMAARLAAMQEPQFDVNMLLGGGPQGPAELEGAPSVPEHFSRIFKFRSLNDRRPDLLKRYRAILEENPALDRNRLLIRLWEMAADFYEDNTGEKFKRWQFHILVQYAKNYARLTGRLLPTTHQCIVAARGVADDNYAWEVFDLSTFYPWTDDSEQYPSIDFDQDTLMLAGMRFNHYRFARRIPRLRERLLPIKHRRKDEERTGDWERDFQRGTICSYPPEDIVIEDYGRYLQKKAITVLSEERTRVEPFTSSILDGIDMRETLRNWAEGRKIYVRECQKVQGGTGSVVLIFDEDLNDQRYPWKMTWHGEHQQESDMAFYATPAQAKIVGPGIARCEYGGLMLTYPPRRLMDVWHDPFYLRQAQTKAEMLLLAGLEYSEDKHVAYVAARPPRTYFRTVAGKLGKKIVYLPIGQLSPVSLKKIRVFHVLSGHDLRKIAKDYIW